MENNYSRSNYWRDLAAAFITSLVVSPTNAILDRSVIEYANGKHPIREGVKMGFSRLFFTPLQFLRSF